MSIDIRLINGPDELQAVLQLRRRIYGEELGYDLPLAPAGQPLAGEALDLTGHLFGAFEGTRLVGAVRVNYGSVDPGRAGDAGVDQIALEHHVVLRRQRNHHHGVLGPL